MAGAPGGIPPQMMAMLQAGGAGGPAPSGGAPPPGGPAPAQALGQMLMRQRMMGQGSGGMEEKVLEQCMAQIGKVLQTIMLVNPKAYQTLLKAQQSLHSTVQELKQSAQDDQQHNQLTSSIMQLLQSSPGGAAGTAGAPPTGGRLG